jgi:hypothetical protein
MDEHQKYLIRETVHSFFSAIPTIDAVYREVQNKSILLDSIVNLNKNKIK